MRCKFLFYKCHHLARWPMSFVLIPNSAMFCVNGDFMQIYANEMQISPAHKVRLSLLFWCIKLKLRVGPNMAAISLRFTKNVWGKLQFIFSLQENLNFPPTQGSGWAVFSGYTRRVIAVLLIPQRPLNSLWLLRIPWDLQRTCEENCNLYFPFRKIWISRQLRDQGQPFFQDIHFESLRFFWYHSDLSTRSGCGDDFEMVHFRGR